MKPETMNILLWAVPVLLAIIGFFCVLGINVVIQKLREISTAVQSLLMDLQTAKADSLTHKERMTYLDEKFEEKLTKIEHFVSERFDRLETRIHNVEMDRSIIKTQQ